MSFRLKQRYLFCLRRIKNLINSLFSKDGLYFRLTEYPEFSCISKKVFEKIRRGVDEITVPKGRVLIRENAPFEYFYVLVKGCVEVKISLVDGTHCNVENLSAPTSIGGVSASLNTNSIADVITTERCRMIRINKEAIHCLFEEYPSIFDKNKLLAHQNIEKKTLFQYLVHVFGPSMLKGGLSIGLDKQTNRIRLKKGEILFHEEDPSDNIYIIINGRLRAYTRDHLGNEEMKGYADVGEVVGEIGVFTGTKRTASVAATRDSLLLSIPASVFLLLRKEFPKVSDTILDIIMKRMKKKPSKQLKVPPPRTIAVIGGSSNRILNQFGEDLVPHLNKIGKTKCITKKIVVDSLKEIDVDNIFTFINELTIDRWFNKLESQSEFLILVAEATNSDWTKFCLKNADAIVNVARSKDVTELGEIEKVVYENQDFKSTDKRLVLLRPEGEGKIENTRDWLRGRDVVSHHHVRFEKKETDLARVARFIANEAVGLVLGGGGERGGAHIGIIKALIEKKVQFDYIGGTSIGAFCGALAAQELSIDQMESIVLSLRDNFKMDYTLPLVSLFKGRIFESELRNLVPNIFIEDLPIPYFAVSSNMTQALPLIHKRGRIVTAIRCSTAIPGLLPPSVIDGDLIVDGGLLNNVPVDIMRKELGGGKIICSDISKLVEMKDNYIAESAFSGWSLAKDWLFRQGKYNIPNIVSILMRAGDLASTYDYLVKNPPKHVDILFRPPVGNFGVLPSGNMSEIINTGYEYAVEVLDSIEFD